MKKLLLAIVGVFIAYSVFSQISSYEIISSKEYENNTKTVYLNIVGDIESKSSEIIESKMESRYDIYRFAFYDKTNLNCFMFTSSIEVTESEIVESVNSIIRLYQKRNEEEKSSINDEVKSKQEFEKKSNISTHNGTDKLVHDRNVNVKSSEKESSISNYRFAKTTNFENGFEIKIKFNETVDDETKYFIIKELKDKEKISKAEFFGTDMLRLIVRERINPDYIEDVLKNYHITINESYLLVD